jgi:hypothetical protein
MIVQSFVSQSGESSVAGGWGSGNRDLEGIAMHASVMWRTQRTRTFPSCIRMHLYRRHYPVDSVAHLRLLLLAQIPLPMPDEFSGGCVMARGS